MSTTQKRSAHVTLGLVATLAAVACDDPQYADANARHCVDSRTNTVVDERECARPVTGGGISPFLFFYGGRLTGGSYYGARISDYSRTPVPGRNYTSGARSFSSFRSARASGGGRVGRGSLGAIGAGRTFGG